MGTVYPGHPCPVGLRTRMSAVRTPQLPLMKKDMKAEISEPVKALLAGYDASNPHVTADKLRELWLRFEPKSYNYVKAEQREQQEILGIPIPVLSAIGKEIGKAACKQVQDFIPLARLLWEQYGREGRVVALVFLGKMELADPEMILPLLLELCRTCLTWEDADRLAMDALEPVVRKQPDKWLTALEPWLKDENKWVRRAAITIIGRLPMKHPEYTETCLNYVPLLLHDEDMDVKKAVSFAIRLGARGETDKVCEFLRRQIPPRNPAATWVLCDAIRSMGRKLLPEFASLCPLYEQWAADPALPPKDRRSVENALKKFRQ